ncbi:MAG TPA: hypothetical protein VFS64_02470 [Solirubrobacterales bacterium]|nr:hypothetical protein [Solirubrobacterales bacterium]
MTSARQLAPSPQERRRREALQAIVAQLGDRLELLSPTDYRAVRESAAEPLPSPAAIWELFGGFHRMRECAASFEREAA